METHPTRTKIIAFLKENPRASIRDIKAATGLSSTSLVDYHIAKLMAEGMLRKIPQRWEVTEGQ